MSKKKSFFWYIYPYFLLVVVVSILSVSWYMYRSIHQFYIRQVAEDLKARAELVKTLIVEYGYPLTVDSVDKLCDRAGRSSRTRVTVILPSGEVVGDSERDPKTMDNHADRPEIKAALKKGYGTSRRFSFTLKKEMMYVAIPLKRGEQVLAVVRTSLPLTSLSLVLKDVNLNVAFVSFGVLIGAALLSFWIAKQISRPVVSIRKSAEVLSEGNLETKILIRGPIELEILAQTLNQMADRLREKIQEVVRQRNELRSILCSMTEGVIALDANERIILMNEAARRILETDAEDVRGMSLQECIRDTRLLEIISEVRTKKTAAERTIELLVGGQRKKLEVRGIPILDEKYNETGMLLLLGDITTLERLENIRQDFVANVSHELKTPITAIRGFVETLLEGAIEDPQNARHFLQIIKNHAGRLEAIVNDLLSLSRLEEEEEREKIVMEECRVRDILASAISAVRSLSEAKSIVVELHCPRYLVATADPMLLEQAVINLLDNSVKYSDRGKKIAVGASKSSGELVIEVKDEGWGIPREHLERIFERFYRVDKARSRDLGGTGLGLAIVKHVARVHGGAVKVRSSVGVGSTFTICIPANKS